MASINLVAQFPLPENQSSSDKEKEEIYESIKSNIPTLNSLHSERFPCCHGSVFLLLPLRKRYGNGESNRVLRVQTQTQ